MVARKWIRERDLDQDGSISLVEFVASYAHTLDPSSKVRSLSLSSTSVRTAEVIII